MNYNLRHLQALVSVARFGSYTQAATELHISRSNLSLTIKELEGQLGFEVFSRTTRNVKTTEAGKAFLPHAERVLEEYQSSLWAARIGAPNADGVLKVAATQLMASTLLPELMQAFCSRYPRWDMQVVDVVDEKAADAVAMGQAEIGLSPERPLQRGLTGSVLVSFPLVCVCAREHAFAQREQVTWKEFAEQKLITIDRQALMMLMRDIAYATHLSPAVEANHLLTGLALASRNVGVMPCMPHVAPLLGIYDLCMVPLVQPVVERNLILMWRSAHRLSEAARAFVALARERIPGLAQEVRGGTFTFANGGRLDARKAAEAAISQARLPPASTHR